MGGLPLPLTVDKESIRNPPRDTATVSLSEIAVA
jgi:hypothetical protein